MIQFNYEDAPRWERFVLRLLLGVALCRLRRGIISGCGVYPLGWMTALRYSFRNALQDARRDDFVQWAISADGPFGPGETGNCQLGGQMPLPERVGA